MGPAGLLSGGSRRDVNRNPNANGYTVSDAVRHTDTSPVPTVTPRPAIRYTVVEGDTCGGIAFFFDITVRSMIEINNLGTECLLSVGTEILVPHPTAAVTPEPTNTLAPAEATEAACPKDDYTVVANDSLFAIAQNYNVSMQSIKDYNGLVSDTVFEGSVWSFRFVSG